MIGVTSASSVSDYIKKAHCAISTDFIARYQNIAMRYCNTLQHTATHCNTPQHTATHSLLYIKIQCTSSLLHQPHWCVKMLISIRLKMLISISVKMLISICVTILTSICVTMLISICVTMLISICAKILISIRVKMLISMSTPFLAM